MDARAKLNEKVYVYCHDCDKLLYKGPLEDAAPYNCKGHTVTMGKLWYFNKNYPNINTTGWERIHPKKGHLVNVRGNVCEPQLLDPDNERALIAHCCNTVGVMGAGVALSLVKKWPKIIQPYSGSVDNSWLGGYFWEPVEDNITIINMVGQKGTVSPINPKPVKYWALIRCMQKIVNEIKERYRGRLHLTPVFHCPKFGSDLAGGNWDVILELIKEIWIEQGFDVVIYEFEPDREKWGVIE